MSVQFDGTNMFFDFIQLDISDSMIVDPEFLTKIDHGQFGITDASAISFLPAEQLNGLFWYKIIDQDLSDSNETYFSMLPDSWPVIHFGSSYVTPETAINHKSNVTISDDFVRSIIRDIMGNLGFNFLFSNLGEMKTGVSELDIQFDGLLRNKIASAGGSFLNPKSLNEISPGGHLWNFIINQEEGVDLRRNLFIDQIREKQESYKNMFEDIAFYYYGNDGSNGEGYYYPLYLTFKPGSQIIQFQNEQEFYIGPENRRGVMFVETPGLMDYQQYVNPFLPIDFMKDDIIKIRLVYHHSETQIYNKTIHPRSYMLYLKLV